MCNSSTGGRCPCRLAPTLASVCAQELHESKQALIIKVQGLKKVRRGSRKGHLYPLF